MKPIKFMTFEKFLDQKIEKDGQKPVLFYSRTFGKNDWGFMIRGLYDVMYKDERGDFIEVQFLTHDVRVYQSGGTMQLIANPENKMLYLKDINSENYDIACKWIEEWRTALRDSITNLTGVYDPLIDIFMRTEVVEQKVVGGE